MLNKKIIAFAGRKRSGKTSLSKKLCNNIKNGELFYQNGTKTEIITIANALKELCCQLLSIETISTLNKLKDTPGFSFVLKQNYKSEWLNILVKSLNIENDKDIEFVRSRINEYVGKGESDIREMLQFIGTDIIRQICPNWHIEQTIKKIVESDAEVVCVDDVRFPNEREAIENIGGEVFFIIRPDMSVDISNHSSETALHWYNFDEDKILINDTKEESLYTHFANHHFPLNMAGYTYNQQPYKYNKFFGIKEISSPKEQKFIKEYILPQLKKDSNSSFVIKSDEIDIANIIHESLYNKHSEYLLPVKLAVYDPFILENLKEWL